MKPRFWAKFRRRPRQSHRHVTITRTVSRQDLLAPDSPTDEEVEEVDEVELVSPGLMWAPAFTGGFLVGVLASLVAGLIVLAIERTMNRRDK